MKAQENVDNEILRRKMRNEYLFPFVVISYLKGNIDKDVVDRYEEIVSQLERVW